MKIVKKISTFLIKYLQENITDIEKERKKKRIISRDTLSSRLHINAHLPNTQNLLPLYQTGF